MNKAIIIFGTVFCASFAFAGEAVEAVEKAEEAAEAADEAAENAAEAVAEAAEAEEAADEAAAEAADAVDDLAVDTVADEEMGFFAKHLAFTHDENLHPQIEEAKWTHHIAGIFLGWIWSPFVLEGPEPGEDFIMDTFISAIVKFILGGWIPVVYFFHFFWWYPVGGINAYNRSVSGGSAGLLHDADNKAVATDINGVVEAPATGFQY